jgi:ribosomal protein S25
LFLGNQKTNIEDAAKKKRMRSGAKPGEQNPMAKLTKELVLKMRDEPRTLSYKKIGQKYGVSTMTAFRAITGVCWNNI